MALCWRWTCLVFLSAPFKLFLLELAVTSHGTAYTTPSTDQYEQFRSVENLKSTSYSTLSCPGNASIWPSIMPLNTQRDPRDQLDSLPFWDSSHCALALTLFYYPRPVNSMSKTSIVIDLRSFDRCIAGVGLLDIRWSSIMISVHRTQNPPSLGGSSGVVQPRDERLVLTSKCS